MANVRQNNSETILFLLSFFGLRNVKIKEGKRFELLSSPVKSNKWKVLHQRHSRNLHNFFHAVYTTFMLITVAYTLREVGLSHPTNVYFHSLESEQEVEDCYAKQTLYNGWRKARDLCKHEQREHNIFDSV